jgi:hypothetical protein
MVNYNPSISKTWVNKTTDNWDSTTMQYSYFNGLLSNKYLSEYYTQVAGVNYKYSHTSMYVIIGIDYQYTEALGVQSYPENALITGYYNSILPKILFNKKFSRYRNLNFMYQTSTINPTMSQLQNVLNISNPLMPSIGNPDLKQQYDHSVRIRYGNIMPTTKHNFFLFLIGDYYSTYIANATYSPISDSVVHGYNLQKGSQLTEPINLTGYLDLKTFSVYGLPLGFLQSNLNFNAGFEYTRTPSMTNDNISYADNSSINGGFNLSSNISKDIDFSISYNARYNMVEGNTSINSNNDYFNHKTSFKINWIILSHFVINTDLSNNLYAGTTNNSFKQDYVVWNAYLGYKFLKRNALEARISVFDILNQNQNISQTVTGTYTENSKTLALKRYLMVSLIYTIRNFKSNSSIQPFDIPKGLPPPPEGMPFPPPGNG